MSGCPHPNCYAPDVTCSQGYLDLTQCSQWRALASEPERALSQDELAVMPWSGRALGLSDIGFVAGRAKPMVVGLIGPQNAGKTTLLAAWYLILGRHGAVPDGSRFAGSYTLEGWERVASGLRWTPGQPAQQPGFPPHTTSGGSRSPGLLHLDFRHGTAERRAFLVADAPGEWFQKWAISRDSPEAEGARWVADHADVLLIIADREALSGPGMGAARGALQNLASRMAAERRGRPVALIWTKADVPIAGPIQEAVRKAVRGAMPDVTEFAVTVMSKGNEGLGTVGGVEAVLEWVMAQRRARVRLPAMRATSDDPLFLFGGAPL